MRRGDDGRDVVRLPVGEPAPRRLLGGEVLDRRPALTNRRRRDGLPCGLADDRDLRDAIGISPAPESIGIEPAVMVRAGVALEPDQDLDDPEAGNRLLNERDELALIGTRDRTGDGRGNEASGPALAQSTDHHRRHLTVRDVRGTMRI